MYSIQSSDKKSLDYRSSVTREPIPAENQHYKKLHSAIANASPEKRIDILAHLWGGEATTEINQEKYAIDQLLNRSGGDSQESKKSARFALALETTIDFASHLGLDIEQSQKLSSYLYSLDDYDSMGEKIRNLLKPLQSTSPQTVPDPALGIDATIVFHYEFCVGFRSPNFIGTSQPSSVSSSAIAENIRGSAIQHSCAMQPATPLYETTPSSTAGSGTKSFEPIGPSRSEKLKIKLFSSLEDVAAGFSSTRKSLGRAAHAANRSVSRSLSSLKDTIQIGSQKFSESITDAGGAVADALHGKTVARMKSSVTRGVERVIGGGKWVLDTFAFVGNFVAHGALHGAKATASFLDKSASFIGSRIASLRGFERV